MSDVKIVGAVPDDERRLREVLRVVSGARFDFIRWREDGERLQSWYHAQGFLEARVRTSRAADPADGRTLLVYTVSRGPRTDLRVVGTAATARLQRALERAWSDGVFDGFRVDEMQRVVALDLVRRDVVGAQVEATVSQPAEGQKRIDVAVTGGTRVSARDVVIRGAESVPARELESALRARGLADYVWVDPASAIEPLKARYAESGFRAVTVTAEVPRIEAGRAVLTVSVTEGPLTTVLPVLLAGVSDERAGEVTAIVRPLEGKPFRTAQVDEVRRRIEALYRARGFNDVAVSPAVVFQDGHLAELSLTVEPGREQRLHEVVVDGAGRTRPSAVVNAVHLGTGEPVDLARWAQARKRVFDTNIFRQVDVRPEVLPDVVRADGAQAVRARVSVTEWPAWRLRYGLQFNDTNQANQGGDTSVGRARGLGVVADLQNRNAFGRAFTFGLFGRAERRLQSSNAYVAFPTLFGRAVRTNVFASVVRAERFFDEQGNPLILQNRSSLSLEQRVRRGRALEIVYGYRVTRDEQDGTDPADPFYLAPVTGRFTGSAFFDRRNDPFNASRGWFASLTAERVSEFVSNADSIKVLGTFYRYQPLGPVTLASAVRVGGSFLGSLAFIDPFFVGGSDTVRGYGDDSLGATNFLGDAQGGNALLVLNQEVRTPIYRWLKGVLFVDAGNVFASNSDVSLSGSKVGYGAGLRLDTPYSLLRFDVARPAQGGGKLRWYLGLGHIF